MISYKILDTVDFLDFEGLPERLKGGKGNGNLRAGNKLQMKDRTKKSCRSGLRKTGTVSVRVLIIRSRRNTYFKSKKIRELMICKKVFLTFSISFKNLPTFSMPFSFSNNSLTLS